jgi:hypothetical protein
MGYLSDAAQKGFKRAGAGAYVPEWYKITVGLGGVLIIVVLAFSALTSEKPEPVTTGTTPNTTTGPIPGQTDDTGDELLRLIGGGDAVVPRNALQVAERSALAIWTGDWSDVPVDGDIPDSSSTFPNASIGKPTVLSYSDTSISFVFSLDESSDGSWDQDFQVTVVSTGSGWAFPAYIG